MGRRSTSRAPGGTAGSIPQSSIAAGTGAGLFESPSGNVVLDTVAPTTRQGNASVANAATFTATVTIDSASNSKSVTTLWEVTIVDGSTNVWILRYLTTFKRVSAGTITLVKLSALLAPGDYNSGTTPTTPPSVTVTASVGSGVGNLDILNSSGAALNIQVDPTTRRRVGAF